MHGYQRYVELSIAVVLNLGSRDPLGVPNANLGGPKCDSKTLLTASSNSRVIEYQVMKSNMKSIQY